MNSLKELIKTGKATIVDVRTPEEYLDGHVPGSINIPLNEIQSYMGEIKSMQNIVLCCASGGRSRKAFTILEENGIQCQDGGSWKNIQSLEKI